MSYTAKLKTDSASNKLFAQKVALPFFNRVAHDNEFHPTLHNEWERWYHIGSRALSAYPVSRQPHTRFGVYNVQEWHSIALKFNSYKEAISVTYPSLVFDPLEFGMSTTIVCEIILQPIGTPATKYLTLLNTLAHSKGFHPTSEKAEWYSFKFSGVCVALLQRLTYCNDRSLPSSKRRRWHLPIPL